MLGVPSARVQVLYQQLGAEPDIPTAEEVEAAGVLIWQQAFE